MVDYLLHRQDRESIPSVPRNIGLPWQFGSKCDLPTLAGPYAAFLGQAHDPVWANFAGAGTNVVPKLTDGQSRDVYDPFAGVKPTDNFLLPGAGELAANVGRSRLKERRTLLSEFDRARAWVETSEPVRVMDRYHSEHGRTPLIDSKPKGAGRHHWSRVYSASLAGGGIARGKVVGRSDAMGGDVADTPVSPKDILATTFHLLGIDPHTHVIDRRGRPVAIAGDGRFRRELC